jgi:hypothetical protein
VREEKYAQWLVENSDKAGSPEYEAVKQAYRTIRLESGPRPAPDPTEGMGGMQKFLAGAGKAMTDVGVGAGQLFGLVSDEEVQRRADRDAPLMNTGAGQAGHIAGTFASFLPTSLIPGANTVTGAALLGSGMGAVQPVSEGQSRVSNTAFGAAGGAVGAKLANALNPGTAKHITQLMDEKITPTPGQALGGGFRKAEEYARSIPVVGSFIEKAEGRVVQDFNKAALARALKPIGKTPQGIGRKGLEYARNEIGDAYDAALSKVRHVSQDQQFFDDLTTVMGQARTELTDDNFNKLARYLEPRMVSSMTGQKMKQLDSDLGTEAVGYLSDATFDNRKLGGYIRDVQTALRGMVQRASPEAADDLAKANSAFANLKRVERAASSLGAEEGVFSPAQLQNAVKALDRSKDKVAFTQGRALMQDLSESAKTALGNKQPDSGTAGRLMTAMMGLTNPVDPRNIYRIPLAATAAAAYSPTGQKALVNALTRRPEVVRALGKALERSPYTGLTGALIGVESTR